MPGNRNAEKTGFHFSAFPQVECIHLGKNDSILESENQGLPPMPTIYNKPCSLSTSLLFKPANSEIRSPHPRASSAIGGEEDPFCSTIP